RIEAEIAETLSTGFDLDLGRPLWFTVSAFQSTIDNALETEILSAGSALTTVRNNGKHRRRGVEMETRHRWRSFTLRNSAYWGEVVNLMTNKDVKGRLKRSLKVALEYEAGNGFTAALQGRYEHLDRNRLQQPEARRPLWDLKLRQPFRIAAANADAELWVIGRNIFHTHIALNEFVRLPGASAEVGLTLRF
ncbi:MAG: TonB-dependent receptor domain-containing protein, partial [Planctomycetota bacterium]